MAIISYPRGCIYQIHFDNTANRLFIVESFSPSVFPSGTLVIRTIAGTFALLRTGHPAAEKLQTIDEQGDFLIQVKKQHNLYPMHYAHHPLM
jgi:homogentisate 1,2-dioxygenase